MAGRGYLVTDQGRRYRDDGVFVPFVILGRAPVPESAFPVRTTAGLVVITTPGEIDASNASLLRAALLAASASAHPVIVVDMTSTEFCDSTGLSVLVRAVRQADADGGQLRLVLRSPAVQRILSVTGVGKLFSIYASLDEAIQAA